MSTGTKSVVPILRSGIPTLAVLLALGAIGYWGHRTDWKLPKFSALRNGDSSEGKDEKGGDESDDSKSAVTVTPPSDPSAGENGTSLLDRTRLQFSAPEEIDKAGIKVEKVGQKTVATTVSAPGEIDYDQTRVSKLSTPVPGRVWRVDKEVGDRVKKGDVVALIDASKAGEAKADFLEAVVQMDLKLTTVANLQTAGSAVTGRQTQEAQAEVRAARVHLFNAHQTLVNLGLAINLDELLKLHEEELSKKVQFLGLPDSVARTLDPSSAPTNLIPLTVPFDGVVVDRQVVSGDVVDSTKPLFTVADLSRVWLVIDVGLEDGRDLAIDQPVIFRPDGQPEEEIPGKISWISTTVDEKTRTMPVRAFVDNPKEQYRAHTFGTAKIIVRPREKALVVPSEAVQRDGISHFVFLRLSDTEFLVREVQCGVRGTKFTEIEKGLQPGDVVVTKGSHILKTEVLKGQLGDND